MAYTSLSSTMFTPASYLLPTFSVGFATLGGLALAGGVAAVKSDWFQMIFQGRKRHRVASNSKANSHNEQVKTELHEMKQELNGLRQQIENKDEVICQMQKEKEALDFDVWHSKFMYEAVEEAVLQSWKPQTEQLQKDLSEALLKVKELLNGKYEMQQEIKKHQAPPRSMYGPFAAARAKADFEARADYVTNNMDPAIPFEDVVDQE